MGRGLRSVELRDEFFDDDLAETYTTGARYDSLSAEIRVTCGIRFIGLRFRGLNLLLELDGVASTPLYINLSEIDMHSFRFDSLDVLCTPEPS